MKNVSVGKKLMLGFAAVILMIAILLALTVVTSISRNNDLNTVKKMSELQRTANTMLDSFNLARVEIRTLFTSIDAEEEYNLALSYLTECHNELDKMEVMSSELDGYMAGDLQTLRKMFTDVENGIRAVGTNDEMSTLAIENMKAEGTVMTESSSEMFDMVTDIVVQMGLDDPAQAVERIQNVIIPVKEINDLIGETRVVGRELMLDQKVEVIPEIYSYLDDVSRRAQDIRTVMISEEAKIATDKVLSGVAGFRAAIEETKSYLDQSEVVIADTRVVFGELNSLVAAFVEDVTQNVEGLLDSSIGTSVTTMYIMIGVGAFAALFSIIVAIILARMVTRPLNKMKFVATQVGSTGNLDFSEEFRKDIKHEAEAKDELGQSILAFTQFVDRMTDMGAILEKIANKDLTVEVSLLSDEDTMGRYIQNMLGNLNEMFAEINTISSQVAMAANEIAIGAQGLAQGSTEQAATVEEISASVSEINSQMNTSNETAMEAARQSAEMSNVAKVGNDKMGQMGNAMHEINEASQNIGHVIKVIDDIAFQTNILALNASVEAARAGEHGKGFAVVADEVRNLAGKSADAAKETSALISTNIEKTEMGLSYTQETMESLTQIMEGIAKTGESLQLVAQQSESAKAATSQVTLAVDQVAQVVQQNSATSEESAAASEQMSSQAQALQQLISEFKLKGSKPSRAPIAIAERKEPESAPPPPPRKPGGSKYDDEMLEFPKY